MVNCLSHGSFGLCILEWGPRQELCENMDKTHFIINMDNVRTLGFRGDKKVKYADMVSDGVGITMVLKVIG